MLEPGVLGQLLVLTLFAGAVLALAERFRATAARRDAPADGSTLRTTPPVYAPGRPPKPPPDDWAGPFATPATAPSAGPPPDGAALDDILLSRFDGPLRPGPVRDIQALIDRHPTRAVHLLRQWMHRDGTA